MRQRVGTKLTVVEARSGRKAVQTDGAQGMARPSSGMVRFVCGNMVCPGQYGFLGPVLLVVGSTVCAVLYVRDGFFSAGKHVSCRAARFARDSTVITRLYYENGLHGLRDVSSGLRIRATVVI